MAITKPSTQVEWSAADTISVTSGATQTSDAVTIDATTVGLSLTVKADNAGTPASGDTISVYVLHSTGDPDVDPDSADEYDDPGTLVAVLDTNANDPAIKTVMLNPTIKKMKVKVVSGAASNSITCSAQIMETRAA